MDMHNPAHPGELLTGWLEDLNITVTGFATHLGIKYAANEPRLKGYILSSPYYENAIKVPPIMIPLIKIFSKIIPKAVIPGPDLTDVLTRDESLTNRHKKDAQDGLRSLKPTMRFGAELLKAQKWVKENFSSWNHPTFAVVAGADVLTVEAEGSATAAVAFNSIAPSNSAGVNRGFTAGKEDKINITISPGR